MTLSRSGRLLAAAASIALSATALGQTPTPAAPPPAAPTVVPTPSSEARAAGKTLLAKVVDWLGGPKKVASIHDVQTRGQLTAKTPQGDTAMEVQSTVVFPDRMSQQIDSPFGRVSMVITPAGAFLVGPNGSQDLPPAMSDELAKQIQRIPLHIAQKADDPTLSAFTAGKAKVGDVEASILEIRYGAVAVRWYVDPGTGRILRTAHTSTAPDGKKVQMVADYSDYRPIDGIPVAHRLEVTTNGERDQTLLLEQCRFNAGVDAKVFDKPPAIPTPAPSPATPAATPAPGA
jgi:hypothetical protein